MDVTLILALVVIVIIFLILPKGSKFELHGYQADFLNKLGEMQGTSAAEALQAIVDKAMSDGKVKAEIFDEFHCIHCGSVSPADWIKERKGNKQPVTLPLTDEAIEFLSGELLVKVGKVDNVKQIIGDSRTSDVHKAVRCCVDWAIKNHAATADGIPKPE